MIVPIEKVISIKPTSNYFIKRMKTVLQKQGQIEPLQVRAFGDLYQVFDEDAHGVDILRAAQELGWPTILITVTRKYEA